MGEYEFEELDIPFGESDLTDDPMDLFRAWYADATETRPGDWLMTNALALGTVDQDQRPHVRVVLMKGIESRGIVFYTNYDSDKGRQLEANPAAAGTFHWPHRYRQVRLEGTVRRTTREMSEQYFHSRPRGSQIGASVSAQSQVIADRGVLERERDELSERYRDQPIPLPDNWGGYEIVLHMMEFWQSRHDRLHDRFRYRWTNDRWEVSRLAP